MLGACLLCTSLCFADEIAPSEEVVVEETTQEAEIDTSSNEAITWLKETWVNVKGYVLGALSGVSISAILGAIFIVCIKRITNKGFDKLEKNTNSTDIANKVSGGILDQLGNCVLNVNMQPLMAKQYAELQAQLEKELFNTLNKQDKKNLALIKCFEAFADYFKCSTAVSDEQREALSNAIAEAKALYDTNTEITAQIEVVAEAPKETSKKVAENY